MKALKIAVVLMGVFIVVGLTVLAYGIMSRLGKRAGGAEDGAAPYLAAGAVLPPGTAVADMAVGDGRLALRVQGLGGSIHVMLFDLETGRHVGTVALDAAP